MGLDATVRCRCYEEGRLKPGPVPFEDLFLDEGDYLYSRTLSDARERFGTEEYWERYGDLEEAFYDWLEAKACEHSFGEYREERIGNLAGIAEFRSRVEALGGSDKYPLLAEILPSGNDGMYPPELAKPALEELDRFVVEVAELWEWVLCDVQTGKMIWASTDCSRFSWMLTLDQEVGMAGGKVYFAGPGDSYVETTHFRQEPIGVPEPDGSRLMRIVCLDQDAQTTAFDSIDVDSAGERARTQEFQVFWMKAPFMDDGVYPVAESLRNVLRASVETGNPVRWC